MRTERQPSYRISSFCGYTLPLSDHLRPTALELGFSLYACQLLIFNIQSSFAFQCTEGNTSKTNMGGMSITTISASIGYIYTMNTVKDVGGSTYGMIKLKNDS